MTWENRLTFEVSSADPDSDTPVWVDLTLRIRDAVQPIEINIGRQDDLEGSSPTVFTLLLDNADDALTYGNTTSPYFAWWAPGRRCRLRETVSGVVMDLVAGYLQMPTETLSLVGVEHRVAVTIVDRLARLASAEPFVSTLAAHIVGTSDSSLKAYWPFNGATETFASLISTSVLLRARGVGPNYAAIPTTISQRLLVPGGGPSVPADDVPSVSFQPSILTSGLANTHRFIDNSNSSLFSQGSITQLAGETISLVFWSSYTYTGAAGDSPNVAFIGGFDPGFVSCSLSYRGNAGTWTLDADGGTAATSLPLTIHPQGVPVLHALRLTIASGLAEFWRGSETPVTALTGGVVPTQVDWNQFRFGSQMQGSMGHVQVYVGAGAYTREQHLAQNQMGLYGLERQTTGERIRTVLGYAGVRGSEMNIDQGSSVMQRASLAGKTPLDALREAENTERGLAFVDGPGVVQFRDRQGLYNI